MLFTDEYPLNCQGLAQVPHLLEIFSWLCMVFVSLGGTKDASLCASATDLVYLITRLQWA